MVRNDIPEKEGLRLLCLLLFYKVSLLSQKWYSRKRRIKTAIKGYNLRLRRGTVRNDIPEKEGLRRVLHIGSQSVTKNVRNDIPEKEGLRLNLFNCSRFCFAVVRNDIPEKEGLKQTKIV